MEVQGRLTPAVQEGPGRGVGRLRSSVVVGRAGLVVAVLGRNPGNGHLDHLDHLEQVGDHFGGRCPGIDEIVRWTHSVHSVDHSASRSVQEIAAWVGMTKLGLVGMDRPVVVAGWSEVPRAC